MITRVAIRNFKAFRDAEINLTSLNLFTGMNGMGKSTFIQSLLLLRQSDSHLIPGVRGLVLKGGDSGIVDLGKGKDVYSIHADNDYIQFGIDVEYKAFLNVAFKFEAENDVLPYVRLHEDTHSNGEPLPALFTNRFTYLKGDRVGPEHNYKANLSAVKNRFLGYRGENTPLFIALNTREPVRLKSVIHSKAKADNLISNLDAWFNEITPGTHVISTYFNELDIVRLGYQFDEGADLTPEFSPVNVGFGFTYTLPVLTAVLAAEEGDLLIIENPESYLHPHGQARMGELLARAANDGVQVIVESHSDHLLNGMRVAVKDKLIHKDQVSVFYFERDKNEQVHISTISQPEIDENGRISHRPDGFFDEYSKQLDSLIT